MNLPSKQKNKKSAGKVPANKRTPPRPSASVAGQTKQIKVLHSPIKTKVDRSGHA